MLQFLLRYSRAMTAARHEWNMFWDKQKNYQRRFRSAKVFRFCACRQHNCVPIRVNFSAEDQSSWRVAVLQPQVLKRSWNVFVHVHVCVHILPHATNWEITWLKNIKRNCVGSTWAGGEVNLVDVNLIKFQAYVWCISSNNVASKNTEADVQHFFGQTSMASFSNRSRFRRVARCKFRRASWQTNDQIMGHHPLPCR